MFDIGWSELLILLIVALVVVGPKDLPKLMRTAGQWMGKARRMADQFRNSFDEMARQSELEELRKEINSMRMQRPLADLDQSILPPDDVMRGTNVPSEDPGAIADAVTAGEETDEETAPYDPGEAATAVNEPLTEPNMKPGDKPPAP